MVKKKKKKKEKQNRMLTSLQEGCQGIESTTPAVASAINTGKCEDMMCL
jgi:hypothetical protein